MFNNPGEKIKKLAVISFVCGIIISVILAFALGETFPIIIAILLGGPLTAYISSLLLYGFGTLIVNTDSDADNTDSDADNTVSVKNDALKENFESQNNARLMANGGWTCSCGRVNASYVSTCACGKSKFDNQ